MAGIDSRGGFYPASGTRDIPNSIHFTALKRRVQEQRSSKPRLHNYEYYILLCGCVRVVSVIDSAICDKKKPFSQAVTLYSAFHFTAI